MATAVQGNAEGVPLTLETTDSDKNGNIFKIILSNFTVVCESNVLVKMWSVKMWNKMLKIISKNFNTRVIFTLLRFVASRYGNGNEYFVLFIYTSVSHISLSRSYWRVGCITIGWFTVLNLNFSEIWWFCQILYWAC